MPILFLYPILHTPPSSPHPPHLPPLLKNPPSSYAHSASSPPPPKQQQPAPQQPVTAVRKICAFWDYLAVVARWWFGSREEGGWLFRDRNRWGFWKRGVQVAGSWFWGRGGNWRRWKVGMRGPFFSDMSFLGVVWPSFILVTYVVKARWFVVVTDPLLIFFKKITAQTCKKITYPIWN